MKRIISVIVILTFAVVVYGADYPSKTHTFAPRQIIPSAKINTNYDTLYNAWADGDKDINIKEYYLNGTKIINTNRDIVNLRSLTLTGNVTVSGNMECTGNLTTRGSIVLNGVTYTAFNEFVNRGAQTVSSNAVTGDALYLSSTTEIWEKATTQIPQGIFDGGTTVITDGYSNDFSGLTTGNTYFLEDDGTVTTNLYASTGRIKLGRAVSSSDMIIDIDQEELDVYNFYVKYPYVTTGTDAIQEQMIVNTGTIRAIKGVLGTDATGASFVITMLNNGVTINESADSYTFADVSTNVLVKDALVSGNTATAENILKVRIDQVGSTITGQDLNLQLFIQRTQ